MVLRRGLKTTLLIGGLVSLTLWFAHERLLVSAANWLNIATPPQQTDYVFVLNGDANVRPFIAAVLVNTGFASRALVVPTKPSPAQQSRPPEANAPPLSHELLRRVMIHQGVPEDKIIFTDGQCTSTFDEIQSVSRYMEEFGDQTTTVAVVTSDFHTRRTRWTCHRVFGERMNQLSFVAAPTEGFDANNWWRVEDGFMTYGTEFLKFGFYAFRYGNGGWIVAVVAASTAMTIVATRIRRQRFRDQGSDEVEPTYA